MQKMFALRLAIFVAFILTYKSVYSAPDGQEETPSRELTSQEIINDAFTAADNDGKISKDELRQILGRLESQWTEDYIEAALSQIVVDGNGRIDREEFDRFVLEERVKTIFNISDKDKDGHLSIDELKEVLWIYGSQPTDEAVKLIMEAMDTDKDNRISFQEFYAAVQGELY